MDKSDVKNILISMKTPENEIAVNQLLTVIDSKDDGELQRRIQQMGGTEQSVRQALTEIIENTMKKHTETDQHYRINKLFTYGINGSAIHLHLPGRLMTQVKGGPNRKLDTVNLYLLDAIEKAAQMKGKLPGIRKVYMISPILMFKTKRFSELSFLEGLDLETMVLGKEQLKDKSFLEENSEAMLAKEIFGDRTDVGRAQIAIDRVTTTEWQTKKDKIVAEFNQKGIFIEENEESENPFGNGEGEEPEQ